MRLVNKTKYASVFQSLVFETSNGGVCKVQYPRLLKAFRCRLGLR